MSGDRHETKKWDSAGVFLSTLCALHCILTPFIAFSLPFWVYTIHYSPVHLLIAVFALPIGGYSFWRGFKKHQKTWILILGFVGLLLLSSSVLVPRSRNELFWNDIQTFTGSLLLIAAHLINRRNIKLQNRSLAPAAEQA